MRSVRLLPPRHLRPPPPLTLLLTPPYADGAFTLHCSRCRFDLHLPCAATPPTLTHRSHPHALALVHGSPGRAGYVCDLCRSWFYACTACDFGGHVGCFASEALPRELYELHLQQAEHREGTPEASSLASLQQRQQPLQQQQRRQASDAMARIRRTAGANAVMLTADPNQYAWRWR